MEQNAAAIVVCVISAITLLLTPSLIQGVGGAIGVNYGTVANNLPPPTQVANFLLESTIINRVRLFDANPSILRAFAHTGIAITVTVPNDQIPYLTKLNFAQQWIKTNVVPHTPATNIVRILVGNEVLSTTNKLFISSLVPALHTLHTALVGESLDRRIKVSTPHSLGILSTSSPPSTGKFRQGYDTNVLKPLLSFLRSTDSPFMINAYPFFGYSKDTLDYALFRPNSKVFDENTELTYTNMLDGQLDAVFTAMKLLGFSDLEIVIAETGWPSKGDLGQVGVDVDSAAEYNKNLLQHVTSGFGTPLMPNRTFETYIFGLFNEDLKPGPTSERNFGLFEPDMTPVYNIGILRSTAKGNFPSNPTPVAGPAVSPGPALSPVVSLGPALSPFVSPGPTLSPPVSPGPTLSPGPASNEKQWCLPKPGANEEALQRNLDYVCGSGLDCGQILEGGSCFVPNTVRSHAAYAMNMYYQSTGKSEYSCDFEQTGDITTVDPSYGRCIY